MYNLRTLYCMTAWCTVRTGTRYQVQYCTIRGAFEGKGEMATLSSQYISKMLKWLRKLRAYLGALLQCELIIRTVAFFAWGWGRFWKFEVFWARTDHGGVCINMYVCVYLYCTSTAACECAVRVGMLHCCTVVSIVLYYRLLPCCSPCCLW